MPQMSPVKASKRSSSDLLSALAETPAFLRKSFGGLSPEAACRPGPGGPFSPVEHVWHLADLEREGFGIRIQRLQVEDHPHLPDFDGARTAIDRDYKSMSLEEGLAEFGAARNANIENLRSVTADAFSRTGTQDGVGAVSLGDIPGLMWRHDQEHIAEITEWSKARNRAAVSGCAVTLLVILVHGALNVALIALYFIGGSKLLPTNQFDPVVASLANVAGYVALIFVAVYVVLAPCGPSIRKLAVAMISLPWFLSLAILLPQGGGGEVTLFSFVALGSLAIMRFPGESVSRRLSSRAGRAYW
jgi:DinB superfamily